ncbi:MAG: hypothetical protein ACR2IP_08605 [Solirubrobacteraceae bacterium]
MGVQHAVRAEEPALSFWLRYAEREGALVDQGGDQALLLLPRPLQQASELPEEVTVTSDPDVARADGAVLLIAGHPAIERAAGAVLAEGDTGHAFLPWPGSRPPARSTLESRARELVPVDHGRIDATGEPIAAYLPLLRVGAMISYAASLVHRFQEQEEAWIDARTGLPASERLLAALRGRPLLPRPEGHRRALAADLALSLPVAHEQLERRAIARQASLAVHARRALESELARADAYYEGTLESIARRRSTAAADRIRLLDAQADATRAEHARRRREIEDELRPRHELRPFRLHVVHVPAFVIPIDVRRGSRRFPFDLTWLAAVDEFTAVRCPACGEPERLIATRDRLGCESCTPKAALVPPSAAVAVPGTPAASATTARAGEKAVGAQAHRKDGSDEAAAPRAGPRARRGGKPAAPVRPRVRTGRSAARSVKRSAGERDGVKLTLGFWQGVAVGDRRARRRAAADSPLRALFRLYGDAAPLCALGIPWHQRPTEVSASSYPTQAGVHELTFGTVTADGMGYEYALSWWTEAGKPVIGEVMPTPHPLVLPPARGESAAVSARLRESAPVPAAELDQVAAALWRAELARSGLPFLARCLATWWRVQDDAEPAHSPGAIAAAVAGAVTRAAGARRTKAESAAIYEVDPGTVERAARHYRAGLRLDRAGGW